jgi:hypothetical protein
MLLFPDVVSVHSAETFPFGAIATAEPASRVTLSVWLPGWVVLVSVLLNVSVCWALAAPMPASSKAIES